MVKTFAIILAIYILLVQVGLHMIVPHLGFRKKPIPKKLPKELANQIYKLKATTDSDLEYVRACYKYITDHFYCGRLETLTKVQYTFHDVFDHVTGHLPCTLQNYLLRIMLIKSGRFRDEDIELETVPFNMIIHQVAKVKVNNKWIYVDPGGSNLGKEFGEAAKWFG